MNYLDYEINLPELDKINEFVFETVTTDFSNPKKIKKIRFIRQISITRYKQNGNDMLFQIFLNNIETTSNLSVENIIFLKRAAAVFDEVELEINDFGKIIKIVNFEILGKRWEVIRTTLSIDNVGSAAESYMQDISNIIKEEQKLISFFSDYRMFGLYFSSLYKKSYPVERKKRTIDCGNTLMTECFYPKDEKFDTYLITGIPAENNDAIKYEGSIEYRNNQIELATLEVEKEKSTILYNINKTII
ncbi:hypothetical protein [Flavobacterium branchiicola]|uniref:Uncharacterized protein n=1 Tax=Flavobacterium branchiicola TaxID=1114875 RepID=A0ABV9PCU3_9FLAO|nr:hypothetical protein [Flavobacterium branchiicola]MBS7253674.1 hypothetical protein [Flavobacterium branchiicola]